jgi:mannonate dehydratase
MKRLDFIKTNLAALGGALLAGGLPAMAAPVSAPVAPRSTPRQAAIKLGMRVSPGLSDQHLELMRQLELGWCRLDVHERDFGYEDFARTQERYAKHGLKIQSVHNNNLRGPALLLGGPEREAQLEVFVRGIKDLGRLGIPVCDTAWLGILPGSQYFDTSYADMNGIRTRIFDTAEYAKIDRVTGRRWSADEVRAALKYCLDHIMPVAESSGVRVAFHPDDPPIPEQGGVARILHTFEDYQRLFAMNRSPNLGANFCVGTWAEAAEATGKPVNDMIRWLAAEGRLINAHFRNIRGVLPRFQETFIDNGDYDLQEVMNTLVEVGFDGLLVPDHVPIFTIDQTPPPPPGTTYQTPFPPAGVAYSAACMRTMLRNACRRIET